MNEARSEEATQSDQQQECILSGGVYLRHRLKRQQLSSLLDILYHNDKRRARSAFRRAGVQEAFTSIQDTHFIPRNAVTR
jgi:hypothetical protein